MPRRPTTKASRASRVAVPTLVTSPQATPISPAHPSHPSEIETDADDVSKLAIGSLTVQDATPPALKPKPETKPFRFLDLPTELRVKVYKDFFGNTGRVIDLDPDNHRRYRKKLAILRTCRTIYNEAAYLFFSTRTFRIFPTHPGKFFKTQKPLLARLSARQRSYITSLELRVGPGWSNPPTGWVVSEKLKLAGCVNVKNLTVFVECDPSDNIFNGFRKFEGYYERFCQGLLTGIVKDLPPGLTSVRFDAYSSVKKSGVMMRGLIRAASKAGMPITWGPERGWTDTDCEDETPNTHEAVTATALLNGAGIDVMILG